MDFPDDYRTGHFVLVGKTGSGKTYYAKYVAKNLKLLYPQMQTHAFVSSKSSEDWQDMDLTVHTSWERDELMRINDELIANKKGLLIFDDFRGDLDYHHDKIFYTWLTEMRKHGTQIIILVHDVNAVPPVVRCNVTHAILTFSNSVPMVAALAKEYLGGNVHRLSEVMRKVCDNAVVKINCTRNTIDIHKASGVSTSAVGTEHEGSERIGGINIPIGVTGASVHAMNRGGVAVNGTYNDASISNQYLQLNADTIVQQRTQMLNYQDMRNRASLQHELAMAGEENRRSLTAAQNVNDAYILLHQSTLSDEERHKLGSILATCLKRPEINAYNFRRLRADVTFMGLYYPRTPYTPPDLMVQTLSSAIPKMISGNTAGVVGDFALTAVSGGDTGLLGGLGSAIKGLRGTLFGRDPPPTVDKNAVKQEIRRLSLLFWTGRITDAEKGRLLALLAEHCRTGEEVTRKTYGRMALKFLKEYFPRDYAQVNPLKDQSSSRRPLLEGGERPASAQSAAGPSQS